jgi:hypothetical protein
LKAVEKKCENNSQREPAKNLFQIHQMVIIPASAQVKGQLWLEYQLQPYPFNETTDEHE